MKWQSFLPKSQETFQSQTIYSQGDLPPDLEVLDEQHPHNSGGNIQRPTTPPGLPQVHGAGWNPPRELMEVTAKQLSTHMSTVLVNWRGLRGLEACPCDSFTRRVARRIWETTDQLA